MFKMFLNCKLKNFFKLGIHLGGHENLVNIPQTKIFAKRNKTMILDLKKFLLGFSKVKPYLKVLFLNKNKLLFISPTPELDSVVRSAALAANQPYVYYFPGVLSNQDMNYSFIKNQKIRQKWSLNSNFAFMPFFEVELLKELNSLYIPTICVVDSLSYEKIAFPIFGNTTSLTRWYFYTKLMSFFVVNLKKSI